MKIRIRRKTGAKTDIYLHKGFRRYFAAAYEQIYLFISCGKVSYLDKPLILEKHHVFSTKLASQTGLIYSVSFWNKGQSANLSNSQALMIGKLKGFYGEESETR